MSQYIPTKAQAAKNAAALDRLNIRFNEVRAELHRLGQAEFIRTYETGPRQRNHIKEKP